MREPRLRDRRYVDGEKGQVLDTSPIAITTTPRAKSGLRSQIQDAIRVHEIGRLLAEEAEYKESFAESNDFNVGDDYIPEDDFDSDLDPPEEVLDTHDELDLRLAGSLKRVFESFGMKVTTPEEPSAPVPEGEKGEEAVGQDDKGREIQFSGSS